MISWPYSKTAKLYVVFIGLIHLLASTFSHASETYYSYLGGSLSETAYAITSDNLNNIYITGNTNSEGFNSFEPVSNKVHQNQNCFVSRINLEDPNANYYFEFAGSGKESCRAISVDSAFNVYVTGETQSPDLPVTTNQAYQGDWDAFIFKLNPLGKLVYASYIGGSLTDYGHGLSLRGIDDVFITGETWSNDFPTTTNAYIENCVIENICDGIEANAFVTHVDTSNSSQFNSEYSSYLGGSKQDKAHSIVIDFDGILHIAGETNSTNFPIANPISDHLKGDFDGFVSLIDPNSGAKKSLIFSSYLGGNGSEFITAITTDSNGNSYLTGSSSSDDFPTSQNAFSQQCATGNSNCLNATINKQHSDIFITKIVGNVIEYSTLLGGSKDETGHAIAVDQEESIYVSGMTHSADFPITDNAIDDSCNQTNPCSEQSDSFLVKINPTIDGESGLTFSSYLGGDEFDNAIGLHISSIDNVVLTGETYSPDLATELALDQNQQNSEAYLQKIEINGTGKWINKITKPDPKPEAASALNFILLFMLSFLGIIFRPKYLMLVSTNRVKSDI